MPKVEKSGNWFKRHKILTGLLAFIVLFSLISAFTSDTNTSQNKSESTQTTEEATDKKESEDSFTDALRKCTVMEAVDIHKTGAGAKTDNAFNDARDTCNNMLADVYKNDKAAFISDVSADWENRKDETIDGKNLEYYLSILGW